MLWRDKETSVVPLPLNSKTDEFSVFGQCYTTPLGARRNLSGGQSLKLLQRNSTNDGVKGKNKTATSVNIFFYFRSLSLL